MKIHELKELLSSHPECNMRFILPDGRAIPADFHVTEVGHAARRSIDCGGTVHSTESCVLQVWLASNDKEHRLVAGKLASILELARPLIPSDDLEVEIEYEDMAVSQYPVDSFGAEPGELQFRLRHKHTDCLAREACGLESGCC
jgi:hypothetical protein